MCWYTNRNHVHFINIIIEIKVRRSAFIVLVANETRLQTVVQIINTVLAFLVLCLNPKLSITDKIRYKILLKRNQLFIVAFMSLIPRYGQCDR